MKIADQKSATAALRGAFSEARKMQDEDAKIGETNEEWLGRREAIRLAEQAEKSALPGGLVMVEIPCEKCINGAVERAGSSMPVACSTCEGTGRVELYGDDATDELERREVAARKAAERRATQAPATYPNVRLTPEERREVEHRAEVAQLAAEGRSGSLARPARRDGEIIAAPIGCAPGWCAYVSGYEERYTSATGATEREAVAAMVEWIECVDDNHGEPWTDDVAAGVAEACGRFGLVNPFAETVAAPARAAWPFDVAFDESRVRAHRRWVKSRFASDRAFAYFQANPAAGFEKRVGGWAS